MKTTTTTHLTLARAASWLDRLAVPPALVVALVVLIVAAGISAVNRIRSEPSAAPVPTPALATVQPVIIIATPVAAAPAPTAAAVVAQLPGNALKHAVVAYGAPDASTAIGAIEQGRTYTILARYGADWLQADVQGSGVVWLKADQVLDLPADLVDLQPAPTPRIVERPVIVYQPAAAPLELAAATPAPYMVTNEPPPACSTERQCNLQGRLANEHAP